MKTRLFIEQKVDESAAFVDPVSFEKNYQLFVSTDV